MTEAIIEVGPANRGPQIKAKLAEYGQQAADLILQNGLLLREYQSGGYYKEDGHKNFDEAIEAMKNAGLLDYGARQARHFIAIINMVETLNIGAEEVKRTSWPCSGRPRSGRWQRFRRKPSSFGTRQRAGIRTHWTRSR
jgi:hypothetical protein